MWLILGVLLASPLVADALVVRTPNAAQQNRFSSGYASAPVANLSANFLLAGFDLSGIGWNAANPGQSLTLISPQHFVGAAHFSIGSGGIVDFESNDGVKRSYVVESAVVVTNAQGQASDLFVGRLSAPIALEDHINFLSITSLPEARQIGSTAYLYGNSARIGTGTIGGFQNFGEDPGTTGTGLNPTRTFSTTYRPFGGGNDAHVEGGDSGSPTFIIESGRLALAGVHSALGSVSVGNLTTYTSFDSSVPFYQTQVNAILAADGYQLTVVPEPQTIALLLAAGLGFALARRNRLRDPAR
jgi:hypothetical protein